MYTREDLRKIMGLHNPEKDQVINAMGQVRSQIGEFMSDKVKNLENIINDKIVFYIMFIFQMLRIDNLERNSGMPVQKGIELAINSNG